MERARMNYLLEGCDAHVTNREPRVTDHSPRPHRNLPNPKRSNQSPSGHNPRNRNSAKKGGEILSTQPEETRKTIESLRRKAGILNQAIRRPPRLVQSLVMEVELSTH
jgi:hypothetical protein